MKKFKCIIKRVEELAGKECCCYRHIKKNNEDFEIIVAEQWFDFDTITKKEIEKRKRKLLLIGNKKYKQFLCEP